MHQKSEFSGLQINPRTAQSATPSTTQTKPQALNSYRRES